MTKVDGIGFKIADHVAQTMGIHSTDPRRLAAGMEYLLEVAESDGHVCLTEAEMLERAPRLLDRGFQKPWTSSLKDAIAAMVADGRLWREPGPDGVERIYTTELYVVETRLYQHLQELLHEDRRPSPAGRPQVRVRRPGELDADRGAVERSCQRAPSPPLDSFRRPWNREMRPW